MNRKELMLISLGIFLTILAWLVIDLYQVDRNNEYREVAAEVSMQNYSLSSKIFEMLKQKK